MLRTVAVLAILVVLGTVGVSYGSVQTLNVEIYTDGLAHVTAQLIPEEQSPALNIVLLGTEVDNFMATGQNNTLLTSEVAGGSVLLNTFDTEMVTVNYDIHDLISKDGRVWTFALNSTTAYTLVMPSGAVIVGMNVVPISLNMVDGKAYLEIPKGESVITYILSTAQSSTEPSPTNTDNNDSAGDSILTWLLVAVGAIGIFVAVLYRRSSTNKHSTFDTQNSTAYSDIRPTPEIVFERIPDLREDDKEIVRYIFQKGGETTESDIRKKFLQPRTTMWRTVKRLERVGAVRVTKRDSLNIVSLKFNPGDTS